MILWLRAAVVLLGFAAELLLGLFALRDETRAGRAARWALGMLYGAWFVAALVVLVVKHA